MKTDLYPVRSILSQRLGVEPERLYRPPELFRQLLENKAQSPTTCNALIRRQAYDDVEGFEPEFRGLYEDQVFFAKLLLAAPTFVSSRYWARYRQHPGNARANGFSYVRYYRERRRFLEWLESHVSERSTAPGVAAAVGSELRRAQHPLRAALAARLGSRAR